LVLTAAMHLLRIRSTQEAARRFRSPYMFSYQIRQGSEAGGAEATDRPSRNPARLPTIRPTHYSPSWSPSLLSLIGRPDSLILTSWPQ